MAEAFPKTEKIWMDGKFVNWDEAKVHVLSHSLHYGSSIFEGIRCYNTIKGPAVFRLDEHIDRLVKSCKIFMIDLPYSHKELVNVVKETIKINKVKECYIRPLIFRGYGSMGLNPLHSPVNLMIAVWPWSSYLGKDGVEKGIRAKISSFSRLNPNTMFTKAKIAGNYVNSALAKMEAIKEGYHEAIMLNPDGYVAEGPGENIFIVRNNVLVTPPVNYVLSGITRESVIQIAIDSKYKFKEQKFTRDEVYSADEVFFTGTAAEITPIIEVDHRSIGNGKPGEITKMLQKKFFDVVHGKDKKYYKWLSFV